MVGGTRRVGRWVSEALLAADWRVHALFRSAAGAAAEVQQQLSSAGLPFSVHQADAAADSGLHQLFADLCGGEPLDLLVNAAGPAARGPLSTTSAAELEDLWRGNVLSVHNALRAGLPFMRSGSSVINFISAGNESLRAYRDVPAYSACKTMLASYSRSLARELAPRGVAVNCIALGVTELPPEGVPALGTEALPTGEYVGQEDVARAVWYLCSQPGAQLTGSVLNLGGGFAL